MDVSKFKDERVHFRNSEVKELRIVNQGSLASQRFLVMAIRRCVAIKRLATPRDIFGAASRAFEADRCIAARRNKMATKQVIVGFKMLNEVFFQTLTTENDEIRLFGGKQKNQKI